MVWQKLQNPTNDENTPTEHAEADEEGVRRVHGLPCADAPRRQRERERERERERKTFGFFLIMLIRFVL